MDNSSNDVTVRDNILQNNTQGSKKIMIRSSRWRVPRFFLPLLLVMLGNVPEIAPEPATGVTKPDSVASKTVPVAPEQSPGVEITKRDLLMGTWKGGGCAYRIDPDGTMRIQRIGAPADTLRTRYAWFRMGNHDCITMHREDGDSLSLQVLLIGEVTDSRAVIALGSPFLRVETGKGITGTWKHLEHLSRMEWKLGPGTVEYRRTVVNPKTGEEQPAESRKGTFIPASGKYEDGSLQLSFDDGARAVVLPIVYRNLMYLFDLSPGKSLFSRIGDPISSAERMTETVQPGKNPEKN